MSDPIVFDSNWMKVRKTEKGFFYSERKGKDSIAVICYQQGPTGREVLIRYQPLVVNGGDSELFPCPITGSMDHDGEAPIEVAIREVQEEAGYTVEKFRIVDCGSYIVGTQTNERVFMFCIDVGGLTHALPEGDGGFHESISHNSWEPVENIYKYEYSAFPHFIKHLNIIKE